MMITEEQVMSGDAVKLPDGTNFEPWEPTATFSKTHYVSAEHSEASDDNPGTEVLPFRTIQRAAEVARTGERILIADGVYREWVNPPRGGNGSDSMIAYHAMPGARVIIKGSQIITPEMWRSSRYQGAGPLERFLKTKPNPDVTLWALKLPREWFDGYNPFACINRAQMAAEVYRRVDQGSMHGFTLEELSKTLMKRGLVFQDWRRLVQVAHQAYMSIQDGTYWVDSDGLTVHVRPFDDMQPHEAEFEVTVRDQLFAPEAYNLGYVWLQGLYFEHAGNGWPLPPVGAVSCQGGHHWVVEDCSISQINAVGLDMGAHREHLEFSDDKTFGYEIIRRNKVTECGVSGIAGTGIPYSMIEENTVYQCGWHELEKNFEQAGIKFHHTLNTVVRRNLVYEMREASGIWLDAGIENTRCCENVVHDITTRTGGIFIEVSKTLPNLVDHNLVFNIAGNGIYEHDVERLRVTHNLVAHCTGAALMLKRGQADRMTKIPRRGSTGRKQRVFNNLLVDCGRMIEFHNDDQQSDYNIFWGSRDPGEFRLHACEEYLDLEAWREFHGLDLHSSELPVEIEFDPASLTVRISVGAPLPEAEIIPGLESDFAGALRVGTTIAGPFAEIRDAAISVDPRS
jgi:hypothetical protein